MQREDVFVQPAAGLGNRLSHSSSEVWLARFSKSRRGANICMGKVHYITVDYITGTERRWTMCIHQYI